ncbi:MAG TPA: universal stress protein [Rhodanobacteraceae bacterium]|nr:universal stress protein [Rhodanobacteraceae bacterium]
MKILLPVDGSPSSSRALRYVIKHWGGKTPARRASLLLLHVDPPLPERVGRYLTLEARARFHEDRARRAVRAARRMLRAAGLPFEERLVVGDPAPIVIRTAAKDHCDLIAMGSHGRGALMSLVLGSVVMKVLSLSRVPVLVAR